jgi:hypothetical protein
MVSANGAKCNFLILLIDFIKEAFTSKCTIVCVIVLDRASSLRHHFFKSFHSKNHLVHCEILHEMNVDKIAYVITECSAPPDARAC